MFNFKKFLSVTFISTAILSMSGGAFASYFIRAYDCTIPDPITPQVCFFTGVNYTGNWYCESGERTVNKVDKAPWKDNIESIKFIDGASVKIYNQFDRNGDYALIEKDTKKLNSDFLNKVRSYRTVEPYIDETSTTSWWWKETCEY